MATEEALEPEAGSSRPQSAGRRFLGGLGEITIIVVGALILSTLLRSFVVQLFVIPSGSMENTLKIGDRVAVSKFGGFQRGDVVVFEDPGNWLAGAKKAERSPVESALEFVGVLPNSGVEYLVKRVIGMPGDRVKCCDAEGAVTVNGVALDESSYLYSEGGTQIAPSNVTFDVIVPTDRIFVMGDHRNASADSRCRLQTSVGGGPVGGPAFVPKERVVGAAVAVVAPLDRLGTFRVPDTFKNIPPPENEPPASPTIIEASPGC